MPLMLMNLDMSISVSWLRCSLKILSVRVDTSAPMSSRHQTSLVSPRWRVTSGDSPSAFSMRCELLKDSPSIWVLMMGHFSLNPWAWGQLLFMVSEILDSDSGLDLPSPGSGNRSRNAPGTHGTCPVPPFYRKYPRAGENIPADLVHSPAGRNRISAAAEVVCYHHRFPMLGHQICPLGFWMLHYLHIPTVLKLSWKPAIMWAAKLFATTMDIVSLRMCLTPSFLFKNLDILQ